MAVSGAASETHHLGPCAEYMKAATLGGGHHPLVSKEQHLLTLVKSWGRQRMPGWPYFLSEALWLQIILFSFLGREPESKPHYTLSVSCCICHWHVTWRRQEVCCASYVHSRIIIHWIWMVLKQLGGADPAGTAVCFATDRQTEILTSESRPTIDVSFPCWVFPWTDCGSRHRLWLFNDFDFPRSNQSLRLCWLNSWKIRTPTVGRQWSWKLRCPKMTPTSNGKIALWMPACVS